MEYVWFDLDPCPLCVRLIIQASIKVYLRVGKVVGEYKIVPSEKLCWVVGKEIISKSVELKFLSSTFFYEK